MTAAHLIMRNAINAVVRRALARMRARYVRMLLRSAEFDCEITHQTIAQAPRQLEHYRAQVRALRDQLRELERC